MKKCFILTSVLALAACSGGSGGGGGAITAPYRDAVRESNQKVTSMISNSEYQVARYVANKLGDDASSVNLSRSTTARSAFVPSASTDNIDYDKARELVDLAAWLASDSTSQTDIKTMFDNSTEDKNKIKAALKLLDGMYCFVGGDAEETANRIITRRSANEFAAPLAELQQRTEVFNLKDANLILSDGGFGGKLQFDVNNQGKITGFELLPDEDDPDDEGMQFTSRTDGTQSGYTQFSGIVEGEPSVLTLHTMGQELGLKYSDFGNFDISLFTNWRVPFIGGYDTKQIQQMPTDNDPENKTLSFHGKATGHVVKPNYYGQQQPAMILLDAPANLDFYGNGNGKTVMTANFDNWYDVEYTKVGNNAGQIAVANYKNNELDGNPDMRFSDDSAPITVTNEEIRYFGDNGVPTEAVGLIQVRDCNGSPCNDHDNEDNLRMNIGFGVK